MVPQSPAIRIADVSKRFGDVEAVRQVDLDIRDGEFFSMLGPSGSGKTTMLRMRRAAGSSGMLDALWTSVRARPSGRP